MSAFHSRGQIHHITLLQEQMYQKTTSKKCISLPTICVTFTVFLQNKSDCEQGTPVSLVNALVVVS